MSGMANDFRTPPGTLSAVDQSRLLATPIRELDAGERSLYLAHLLRLGEHDRYLRFGSPFSDSAIAAYVAAIDFAAHLVFGVFDDDLNLDAAGHFAPVTSADEVPQRSAEFGLSVLESARGRGLGTAMFLRAAAHARNTGVAVLFMHCLSENRTMMRIARRAGMEIHQSHGETDAYLALEPGDLASALQEGVQRQIALLDYGVKKRVLQSRRMLEAHAAAAAL